MEEFNVEDNDQQEGGSDNNNFEESAGKIETRKRSNSHGIVAGEASVDQVDKLEDQRIL